MSEVITIYIEHNFLMFWTAVLAVINTLQTSLLIAVTLLNRQKPKNQSGIEVIDRRVK